MSPGSQDQPETPVRRPRGWVLCALYNLVTAPLAAGIVLAFGLLKATLSAQGTIDLENDFVAVAVAVLQFLAAAVTVQLVFLVFRARYRIRPAIPREGQSNLAPTVWAFGAFLLSVGLLFAAYRLGFTAGKPESLDMVALVMAFITVAQWPLRALLETTGAPPRGPDEAPEHAKGSSV